MVKLPGLVRLKGTPASATDAPVCCADVLAAPTKATAPTVTASATGVSRISPTRRRRAASLALDSGHGRRPTDTQHGSRARDVVDPERVGALADVVKHCRVRGTAVDLALEYVLVAPAIVLPRGA